LELSYINIATEDALGQAVASRLVTSFTRSEVHLKLGQKGFGHLKNNLKRYIELADQIPLLLLTDLDQLICAPALVGSWIGNINILPGPNFIFRVAVKEVESWVLADEIGCKSYFGFKAVPKNPDTLADPKRTLLNLAAKAKREIRENLIVTRGAIAAQGVGYNAVLTNFVEQTWDPDRAILNSPSLRKACDRLRSLEQ
jgi:hypothetical protein